MAASIVGLTTGSVLFAAILVAALGAFAATRHGARVRADLLLARDVARRRVRYLDAWTVTLVALASGAAWLVWRVYERAMFEGADGRIAIGVDHNLGDLPFHLAVINSFVHGHNFPPEHPELAGVRLTYPFLADYLSAMLIRAGSGLRDALFTVNVALALSLVALVFRWASHLTRDRLAAVLTPLLIFFSGGFGFRLLADNVDPAQGGLVAHVWRMTHDYTILGSGELRWGNLVITMLMPQRSVLLGMPMVIAVWTLWWRAVGQEGSEDPRRAWRLLAGAGAITGLLPLAHAHALAVTLAIAAVLAILTRRFRDWSWYFAAALALAVPQLVWLAWGSALQTHRFVAWHVGWDRGTRGVPAFWLDNLGLFIPLLIVALVWGWMRNWLPRRVVIFYLPFLGCFLVPNVLQLSPWIWDNIKFLVWWHLASAPIVALLLARVWRQGGGWRWAAALAALILTLSGALDVFRVASRSIDHVVYSGDSVAFGHRIRAVTDVGDVVLHAPTYNSEVYLAGRRSVLGYTGHTWSQGLDAGTREDDVRAMYAGGPRAEGLLAQYGVDYVLVGPREREMRGLVNEDFFERHPVVAESADHRLYRVVPDTAR